MIPFDDEDDAVRIANDSPYGLAGNAMRRHWTASLAVAAGRVPDSSASTAPSGYGADTPFGGYRPAESAARTASPVSTSTPK